MFQEKLAVCRDLLYGFDYRDRIFTNSKEQLADCIVDGTNWLLAPERKKDRDDFLKQTQLLASAESLCKSMIPEKDQHEAAFIHVLRVQVMRIVVPGTSSDPNKMSYKEFNKRVADILQQSVKSDGVINLMTKDDVEVSLFDESFLEEIRKMKEKNIAFETLRRLIKEQIHQYQRTSVVQAEKFSVMLQQSVNGYLNGMLTNAQVIEELLEMAKEMMQERKEGAELGLNKEELAFYDALTKPQAVKDFYTNDQLIAMTKELTESLRKNATIDWQEKRSARAGMRRAIKHLLKRYKYPPEDEPSAIETVMKQYELWADNQMNSVPVSE